MAPPKPTGKFKPRKQGKKITVGASTSDTALGAPPQPDMTDGAPSATAPSATAPRNSSGRRGGRGRGRGRGGRGAMGGQRSQTQLPRGDVFFTGAEAQEGGSTGAADARADSTVAIAAAATEPSRSKRSSRSKLTKATIGSEEIIVMELDEGVGSRFQEAEQSGVGNPSTERRIKEDDDKDKEETIAVVETSKPKATKTMAEQLSLDTFDSDSSEEEPDEDMHMQQGGSAARLQLPPTQLPFPLSTSSLSFDEGEQPAVYASQEPVMGGAMNTSSSRAALRRASPFVNVQDPEMRRVEEDSWFSIQLPTRLPPLQQAKTVVGPDVVMSGESVDLATDSSAWASAEVATQATVVDGFDSCLSKSCAGRLGKLVVYKSGKTVLILGGGDTGRPEIRMNVDEGLPCAFVQQAVIIDTDEGNYINLGEVKKTVVVTPDIDQAFSVDNSQ